MALTVGAVAHKTAIAGPVADIPTNNVDGFGFNQKYWPGMTAALNVSASAPIATVADLSNLPTLMQYSGLWVDVRATAMTSTELTNLQAYIATGRRVVLVGANLNYGPWNSSILSAVGGTFSNTLSNGSSNSITEPIPDNGEPSVLTINANTLTAYNAGLANLPLNGGFDLYDQPVATRWGPAGNAVVYLNSLGFSSNFSITDYFRDNDGFATNLAGWINGNLSSGSDRWTAGAGSWTATANWGSSLMPSSGDDAQFTAVGSTVTVSSPITCRNLNVSSSQMTLDLPANGGLTAYGGLTLTGSSTLSLTRSSGTSTAVVSATSVNVAAGSVLSVGIGTTLSSPNITGDVTPTGSTGHWVGTIDLGTGTAQLTGVTIATVTDQVRQGYNEPAGGNWTGTGFTSSAAASDTTHMHAIGIMPGPAGTVTAAYTLFGDANLDGKVDGSDYTLIDAGFASRGALTGWTNGDFNYDGVVDGSDYALIDNVYNNQVLSSTSSALTAADTAQPAGPPSAVPEPAAAAGLSAACAVATIRLRKRRGVRNSQ